MDHRYRVVLLSIVNATIVERLYSSALTTSSRVYAETGCLASNYYEAVQLNIVATGRYRFSSNSSVNLDQYIYRNTFYPFAPSANLLAVEPALATVQLSIVLQANTTYVLVVTSAIANQTGAFSIDVTGPNRIGVRRPGKFDRS